MSPLVYQMNFLYEILNALKWPLARLLIVLLLLAAFSYYLLGTFRFKDYGDFIIRLLEAIAWPLVTLILAILFYNPIVRLLGSFADFLSAKSRTDEELAESGGKETGRQGGKDLPHQRK